MALSYGFFNSVDGDRVYNADTMSGMFEGLISGGVYENVGNAFIVRATSGMVLSVGSGRAIVGGNWVKNDADVTITLNAAHVTLNRWTAIALRRSTASRDVSLVMIDGTPASTPAKPSPTRDATTYEIILAYVYVKAGATAVTQADIYDVRPETTLCGWVTGLIDQVNTEDLFIQWQQAYSEFYASFQSWFDTLTSQLQVNTYLYSYKKHQIVEAAGDNTVTFEILGYEYSPSDTVMVYINGLYGCDGVDYTLNQTGVGSITTVADKIGTVIDVVILKSKIGDPVPSGGGGNLISGSTSVGGNAEVNP